MAKYNVDFAGNVAIDDIHYNLTSATSAVDISFQFRNGNITGFLIYLKGLPIYALPMPPGILSASKVFFQRYQVFTNATYVRFMIDYLESTKQTDATLHSETLGNIYTQIPVGLNGERLISFGYTANGATFNGGIGIGFTNGTLTALSDTWDLYPIGGTEVNLSKAEATEIAYAEAGKVTDIWVKEWRGTTYYIGPVNITHFAKEPNYAELESMSRNGLAYPCWHLKFNADQPQNFTNAVDVGVFADTGQLAYITPLGKSTIIPSPSPTPSNSPTQQPTSTLTQSAAPNIIPIDVGIDPLPYITGIVAVVIVAITVAGLAVYFTKFRQKNEAS